MNSALVEVVNGRRSAPLILALMVMFVGCGVEGPPSAVGQLASCLGGSVPFPAARVTAPPLDDDGHPAMPAVRGALRAGHLRDYVRRVGSDVRFLVEHGGKATFALGDTTGDFPYAIFEKKDGRWQLVGSGSNCQLHGWARGRQATQWWLREPVTPASSRVSVLLDYFGCASTDTASRIDKPSIAWTKDSATVTLTVREPKGPRACAGSPPVPFTVELPGPLGQRTLLDGARVPPANPSKPLSRPGAMQSRSADEEVGEPTPAPTASASASDCSIFEFTHEAYKPQVSSMRVCPGAARVGETVTISGRNCGNPGYSAYLYFHGDMTGDSMGSDDGAPLGEVRTSDDGSFSVRYTIPPEVGPYQTRGGGPVRPGKYGFGTKPPYCEASFEVIE